MTVLAGDTDTVCDEGWAASLRPFVRQSGRPWFATPGNHEYYGGKIDGALDKIRPQAEAMGIRMLENEVVVAAGVRILCCTLWTDFRLHAGEDIVQAKLDASYCVGTSRYSFRVLDYWKIKVRANNFAKLRPIDTVRRHAQSVRWLDETLAIPFDGPTVVVTHHAPSPLCVPPGMLLVRSTCADVSRLDWLVEKHQPAAWIWGHVHETVPAFRIGRTQMVSNPRGYYPDKLNPTFRQSLVVEV